MSALAQLILVLAHSRVRIPMRLPERGAYVESVESRVQRIMVIPASAAFPLLFGPDPELLRQAAAQLEPLLTPSLDTIEVPAERRTGDPQGSLFPRRRLRSSALRRRGGVLHAGRRRGFHRR